MSRLREHFELEQGISFPPAVRSVCVCRARLARLVCVCCRRPRAHPPPCVSGAGAGKPSSAWKKRGTHFPGAENARVIFCIGTSEKTSEKINNSEESLE